MKKAMLLMFLIGCAADPVETHRTAEALWSSSAPASYAYEIESYGILGRRIDRVTVEAGAVISSEGGLTIDELLTSVEAQISWEDCQVIVEYDEELGFPKSVKLDCGEDGEGWTITGFDPR